MVSVVSAERDGHGGRRPSSRWVARCAPIGQLRTAYRRRSTPVWLSQAGTLPEPTLDPIVRSASTNRT